jgi:hypothetical protein
LPITRSAGLAELMTRRWPDPRTRIGFESLSLLLRTGRLHSWTGSSFVANDRIRADLLWTILSGIEAVGCQNGLTVDLRSMLPAASRSGFLNGTNAVRDPAYSAGSP